MRLLHSLLWLLLSQFSLANEGNHIWKDSESIVLWVNKVGPFNNPTETYPYYSKKVPFCDRAEELQVSHSEFHYHKFDGLGSVLQGNSIVASGIPLKFKQNQAKTVICTMSIGPKEAKKLRHAVENKYWYSMYVDDLPLWGMVGDLLGETEGSDEVTPHVYTQKTFSIAYNVDRIIEVNLTSEEPEQIQKLEAGKQQKLTMTYSVNWVPTTKTFKNRFDRYLDFDFFEHQIHWFSLFNSFMMVIFLVGLVSLILMRTLKKDYERFTADEETALEYDNVVDETGWKQVHGDVFRPPSHLSFFSAVVGSGFQLFTTGALIILIAIFGDLYDDRGSIATSAVVISSLSSFFGGMCSAWTFLEYEDRSNPSWKTTMFMTGSLLPSIVFCVMFCLNTLAWSYGSTTSIGFSTAFYLIALWLVSMVLLVAGTIAGRQLYTNPSLPCPVRRTFVRPIPPNEWYMRPWFVSLVSGVLPFGSIFIEMYFIFTSFWNYKFYYVYGFMLLVFIILTIVTVCVTIVSTYFLLNAEDHRWKWTSVCSGGSTGLYVFLYAAFYFQTKTLMSGLFQTAFYFGYMFLFSVAVALCTGAVGYWGTNVFVKSIYANIKAA